MAKGKKSLKSSKQDVEIISPEGDSPVDDGEEPTPFLKISNLRALCSNPNRTSLAVTLLWFSPTERYMLVNVIGNNYYLF